MSVHTASHETRSDRRRAQRETGATAERWAQPWTPAEDHELLHGDGFLRERAARIGRTYYAAQWRLQHLRKLLAQLDEAGAQ